MFAVVLYYFTSELEIKPQPCLCLVLRKRNYFTSELEIKPQQVARRNENRRNYFTSELEIKPQPYDKLPKDGQIILLPN